MSCKLDTKYNILCHSLIQMNYDVYCEAPTAHGIPRLNMSH